MPVPTVTENRIMLKGWRRLVLAAMLTVAIAAILSHAGVAFAGARPTLTDADAPRAEKVVQRDLNEWRDEWNADAAEQAQDAADDIQRAVDAGWSLERATAEYAPDPVMLSATSEGCDLESRFRFVCDYTIRYAGPVDGVTDDPVVEDSVDVVVRRNGKLAVRW